MNLGHYLNFSSVLMTFLILGICCSVGLLAYQTNLINTVFSFIIIASFACLYLIIIGAELLGLLVLIIYIGVVAVLFLFIIIMYQFESITSIKFSTLRWISISGFGGFFLFRYQYDIKFIPITFFDKPFLILNISDLILIFNEFYDAFLGCGLLIFIAILGSVSITAPLQITFKKC